MNSLMKAALATGMAGALMIGSVMSGVLAQAQETARPKWEYAEVRSLVNWFEGGDHYVRFEIDGVGTRASNWAELMKKVGLKGKSFRNALGVQGWELVSSTGIGDINSTGGGAIAVGITTGHIHTDLFKRRL